MTWSAVLLLIIPAIGLAETALEFHQCSPYVEESAVGENTDHGWPIFMMFTELGARSLEKVTEANVGRVIHIVVGDREFLRAGIVVPNSSGRLLGALSSQDVAMTWQSRAPCQGNYRHLGAARGAEKCLRSNRTGPTNVTGHTAPGKVTANSRPRWRPRPDRTPDR